VRLLSLSARTEREIETAFATIVEERAGALLIGSAMWPNGLSPFAVGGSRKEIALCPIQKE
jgi:hypothetical protein